MQIEIENPFGVTKATEFSDTEIFQYWVDVRDKSDSIFHWLRPTELMPKFILGSKGCGKTHLLRYHSYAIQKLKHNSVRVLLEKEKYIGIYSIFGGLNSTRFAGKGIQPDQWEQLFEYYLEIYIAQKLLTVVNDVIAELDVQPHLLNLVFNYATRILLRNTDFEFDSINSIINFLAKLGSEIDFVVNNAALTRNLNLTTLRIRFNAGDLLYGIPGILESEIPEFKNLKFVYILDELEKFSESQKRYINTLIWDKRNPCTFWIGARNYGYTTKQTKTTEEIKLGSEFELIKLDDFSRSDEKQYAIFAANICAKRITKHIIQSQSKNTVEPTVKLLNDFFESFDEDMLLNQVREKFRNKPYPHIENLIVKLQEGFKNQAAPGVTAIEAIPEIVKKLQYEPNPIMEKCKIFFFYQLWADGDDLTVAADLTTSEFTAYLDGNNSRFKNVLEKYKKDLTAQLLNEIGYRTIHFSGIRDIIDISWGNARSFLVILKKIYQWAIFNGEKPFMEGQISITSQNSGILEASKWFYDDAEIIGPDGKSLYSSITLLGQLFHGIRYSDKPSETSPAAFFVKPDRISETSKHFINLAVDHSFLIKIDQGRKDKNSDRIDALYQLNRMLAPLYQLPVSRRGTINLSQDLAEAVFDPKMEKAFNTKYNEVIGAMTAPYFGKKTKPKKEGQLFDHDQ